MKGYDSLCSLELKQQGVNPGSKSPYKEVMGQIKDACVRFTNQVAICKTHFKRVRSAAKGKAKPPPAPAPKDEEDEE